MIKIQKDITIAVTGAAGQIGYAVLFRIASGEMFGRDTKVNLRLLELPQAMNKLEGVAMELEDCAFPMLGNVTLSDKPAETFKNIDWALLIGSVPRKADMERNDLLKINGKVFIEQGQALSSSAKTTCKVLVVGNPCNTNAYIAKKFAPNLKPENFFALMMLDEQRAKTQIAKQAHCNTTNIKNFIIWGNHSSTQYPDFYNATITGKPVLSVIQDEAWLQKDFLTIVQQRGAAIIQKRGVSSAASAANAIITTVQNLSRPTNKGECFSVAVCSDGSYGVEKGLIFGFPVTFDGQAWRIIQGIKHNQFAQDKIQTSLDELLKEKTIVADLQ